MSIVSSTSTAGHAQKDGRAYVREEHTDHLGAVHRFEFGPVLVAGVDLAAIRAARSVRIEEFLADAEFRDRITRVSALGLEHQTAAQFASRLREVYRTASRERLCAVAWWMIEMIAAGHVTDAAVRTAFGMSVSIYNTFKTNKLQPAHDNWAAVMAAQGE